jgi:hypothetical protein
VPTSNPISINHARLPDGTLICATVATAPRGTEVSGWEAGIY